MHSVISKPCSKAQYSTGKFRFLSGSYRRQIATKQRNAVQNAYTRDH